MAEVTAEGDWWILDTSAKLIECVDVQICDKLLVQLHLLPEGERVKFVKYARRAAANNGKVSVSYQRIEHRYGRFTSEHNLSLQTMNRPLRALLCRGSYVDIDMVNAHPLLLKSLCDYHKWYCPVLDNYIENREAILQQFNVDRGTAKIYVISMMYGQNVAERIKKENSSAVIPEFVNTFRWELRRVAQLVAAAYPDFVKLASEHGGSKNILVSALALKLQDMECQALLAAVRVAMIRKWVPAVLIHDGFMLYTRPDAGVTQELLEEMQDAVKQHTGVQIALETKEFDKELQLSTSAPDYLGRFF